jgi:hypothetical protein
VAALLASPAGRFVRELEVHGAFGDLPAQLKQTPPRVLTGLAVVGGNRGAAVSLAPVTSWLSLKRLAVIGVEADFFGVQTEGLTALHLRDVRHATLGAFLARLEAPTLRELTLQLDAPLEQKTAVVGRLPGLESLALEDDLADELARWAATASVVRVLRTLGLCGPMTDLGLDALLIEAARLSRLSALTIDGGHFGNRLKRQAYRQLPAIAFNTRRSPWTFW